MILHIVHHYIPYDKINQKPQEIYIFQILSEKLPKFGQKGPFFNFPINFIFFRLQRLGLAQKITKF